MLGIARTPVFTRTKWLCDGCGLRSFALKGILLCKVELKSADLIVMAASMLLIAAVVDAVVV